jgi:S-formylglutathione hydrolase FrmB
MRNTVLTLSWLVIVCAADTALASELVDAKLGTKLLPAVVEYAALLPDGYESARDLPLLFFLHGGGGDKTFLARMRPAIDELWKAGTLPPMVIVTPSAGRSFYMDYKDGSEKWETFIVTEFLDHLRVKFKVTRDRKGTLLFGISMGGMGALRMGFKYSDKFGALGAMEPGIDPVFKWKDLSSRYKFYRGPDLMERIFGKPFDEVYWEANNVASIAVARADRLRASGLSIYIEAGDEDSFYLHEAAEFLHRILWEQKIPHEYHLVRGADHVGRTIRPRAMEALAFLGRMLNPSPPDPEVEATRKRLEPLKRAAEKKP